MPEIQEDFFTQGAIFDTHRTQRYEQGEKRFLSEIKTLKIKDLNSELSRVSWNTSCSKEERQRRGRIAPVMAEERAEVDPFALQVGQRA